jgi:hypothetical protein
LPSSHFRWERTKASIFNMLLYSISKTFASFAALATVCVGVDITFYVSGGCPSDAAVVECAGYGYGGCCYLNDFLAESVSFKALEDTWCVYFGLFIDSLDVKL